MLIVETNTGLVWRWDGTNFQRVAPAGMLKTTAGAFAFATRTTDFSTSSLTFVVCLGITNVVVPAGMRPIAAYVSFGKGENTAGNFTGAVMRSNTAAVGPQFGNFSITGDATSPTAGAQGSGGTYVAWETAGITAGTYSFSFQIKSSATFGGTSHIRADSVNITRLAIVEL
jgi:hypothetical protein